MKKKIENGFWGGQPIWRQEEPRETLLRVGTEGTVPANVPKTLRGLNFFADIIEGQERVHLPIIKKRK